MGVLSNPTLLGPEPSIPGMFAPNASCLQIAQASCATDWTGAVVSPQLVDSMFSPSRTGHTIEEGQAVFNELHVPNEINDGTVPIEVYLPAAIDARHKVIIEYQCDGYCRPVPRGTSAIRHFVVGFGYDAINYAIMQSWTRQYLSVPRGLLEAACTRQHIEITGVMPTDQGGSSVPTDDEIAMACRIGKYMEGELEFSSAAERNQWVANAKALNQSLESIVYLSRDSSLGQQYWRNIQSAIALAQQFPAFQTQLNAHLAAISSGGSTAPAPVDPAQLQNMVTAAVAAQMPGVQAVVQSAVQAEMQKLIAAIQGVQP